VASLVTLRRHGLVGPLMAGWCAAGVLVAWAMCRPTSHHRRRRALLAVAWCFTITMLLVIPDIRLLQNLAYGLLFVFVKLDWAVLNQAVIVLGGIFWAMTAISYPFVRLAFIEAMGLAPQPARPPTYTGRATWTPGWLWPFWGIALAIATSAYYHRRRHRGSVAAGSRLSQEGSC